MTDAPERTDKQGEYAMIRNTGPTSHHYISQRLRLHYVDWGNHGAPPLILLHGGQDHCRNWDWVAQKLREDWHVICPDLAGHGDSEWTNSGNYRPSFHVYDLAQLIHQKGLAPVTIVAHSLGGNIAMRYAGLYPDNVAKLVAIEGLGLPPQIEAERKAMPIQQRMRGWIEDKRKVGDRGHKRYADFEGALARMWEKNSHLSEEQARHLTTHAVIQNEDGTYSWKFDPHLRVISGIDLSDADVVQLIGDIRCPTLLCYGEDSWASNPLEDGRINWFNTARVVTFPRAGHWLHHDRFDMFVQVVTDFLAE